MQQKSTVVKWTQGIWHCTLLPPKWTALFSSWWHNWENGIKIDTALIIASFKKVTVTILLQEEMRERHYIYFSCKMWLAIIIYTEQHTLTNSSDAEFYVQCIDRSRFAEKIINIMKVQLYAVHCYERRAAITLMCSQLVISTHHALNRHKK